MLNLRKTFSGGDSGGGASGGDQPPGGFGGKKPPDDNMLPGLIPNTRPSIRDKLLVREVQEMAVNLPQGCKTTFPDPDALHEFILTVCPPEGMWNPGKFKFKVFVPQSYNMDPPQVTCLSRILHPNIAEEPPGHVCLSLLRVNPLSDGGWTPVRTLKDVIWGVSGLFGDLLSWDDAVNEDAVKLYHTDKRAFSTAVRNHMEKHGTFHGKKHSVKRP